ncbi:MAG: hypothetical protein HY721_01590 [Planctomycetes bacterium]|nr:hypothetical protein [Planctomycetota bacterium]
MACYAAFRPRERLQACRPAPEPGREVGRAAGRAGGASEAEERGPENPGESREGHSRRKAGLTRRFRVLET